MACMLTRAYTLLPSIADSLVLMVTERILLCKNYSFVSYKVIPILILCIMYFASFKKS